MPGLTSLRASEEAISTEAQETGMKNLSRSLLGSQVPLIDGDHEISCYVNILTRTRNLEQSLTTLPLMPLTILYSKPSVTPGTSKPASLLVFQLSRIIPTCSSLLGSARGAYGGIA